MKLGSDRSPNIAWPRKRGPCHPSNHGQRSTSRKWHIVGYAIALLTAYLLPGCPAAPSSGGSSSPACEAVQICRDLRSADVPVESLPLLEGALEYCDRQTSREMSTDEFCGYCAQASGTSPDEITYCQDPVEQIVADELDYVAKLDEVRANVENGGCSASAGFDSAVVGDCDETTAFLLLSLSVEGESLETGYYYDLFTGDLLGVVRESTIAMPPCCGRFLWPGDLQCSTPVVVEAICGSSLQPGDSVRVP